MLESVVETRYTATTLGAINIVIVSKPHLQDCVNMPS